MDIILFILYFSRMKNNIPLYGLYGEELQNSEPGPIHIEKIRDRSSVYGWHIKAHRHKNLLQILHVNSGLKSARFDDQHFANIDNASFLIPPGIVHEFTFSPKSEGEVISVSLDKLSSVESFASSMRFIYSQWNTQDSLKRRVSHIIEELQTEIDSPSPYQQRSLELLLTLLLDTLIRRNSLSITALNDHTSLSQRFLALIEKNYKQHVQIEQYAQHLGTTYSTLNRVCLKALGRAPKTILHQRLVLESQRKLIYTTQTIEEISYSLGFKDPAYFNRFFKKQLGITPGEYRSQHTYQ